MKRLILRSALNRSFYSFRSQSTAAAQPQPDNKELEELIKPTDMTPTAIVEQLDKYVIGQKDAKRAVAVALRNRWRRHRVSQEFKEEIYPKNILMIGPTGVGKSEISRRVAKLTDAPFIRVECTKFTEVGFHGRDVDSIIEDLYKAAITMMKNKIREQNKEKVKKLARDAVLKALVGSGDSSEFEVFLDNGELDNQDVTIEVPAGSPFGEGNNQIPHDLRQFIMGQAQRSQSKTMKVHEALKVQEEIEMEKLMNADQVSRMALKATEQDGIVVLDEIDKICTPSYATSKHNVSSEGVQQDLLPLVEGTTVTTKSGVAIKTDHILFIASGAFSVAKPSDMIAELQGRLPLRVELQPLTKDDFYRILTEPKTNLIYQNIELLKTENVNLEVKDDAIREMAEVAFQANSTVQNIGARRLITVVEKTLEKLGFEAPDLAGQTIEVTSKEVRESVGEMLKTQDLHKLII